MEHFGYFLPSRMIYSGSWTVPDGGGGEALQELIHHERFALVRAPFQPRGTIIPIYLFSSVSYTMPPLTDVLLAASDFLQFIMTPKMIAMVISPTKIASRFSGAIERSVFDS
eukprot:GHVH01012919.1.p1 GENE.GHVH01012919.1~~GHVH01012919.1.p1  ORF type:complete len:112 (-),score=9.61 GHVH01012919.1:140-475(-)